MIQLIASDMDGTLLGAKMEVSEENAAAIRYANEQGIEFMVATGRQYNEAVSALNDANIRCGMITVNGAQVFDASGKNLFTISIPKESARSIMTIFDQNQIYFEVCTSDGVYSNNRAQRIENTALNLANRMPHLTFKMAINMASAYLEMLPINYVSDMYSLLEEGRADILKFIAISEQEQTILEKVKPLIHELGELSITSSHHTNIEINHIDAQKGIALARVAKEKGISMENVMAIGDNLNDLSMIELAGVSFAMENGADEVKQKAKYAASTNTDSGVGKAVMRAIHENL